METKEMTGKENLEAIKDGKIDPPTMSKIIPMECVELNSGSVIFYSQADHRHMNSFGTIHGGFAATVLDSVTGCAVHSMLEPDIAYSTIELDIKTMRPVPIDKQLIAEVK